MGKKKKKEGKSGKKWEKVGKSGKNVGKVGKFLFFSRSTVTRQPRSCSERGPSARSCQKINFKYFYPPFSPLFPPTFSHFFPLFPPFPTFSHIFSPFFSPFPPFFSLFRAVKIPKKRGDLTSILLRRCNSLRYTSCSRMSSLLLTQLKAL